jgi:hypothetical protein
MSDKETVVRECGDLAPLFKDAPPLPLELTHDEITLLLLCIQGAGYYAMLSGEIDPDEILDRAEPIKAKFQAAMQEYLDKS